MKAFKVSEGVAAFMAGCALAVAFFVTTHAAHAIAPPAPKVKDVLIGTHTASIDRDCHVWQVDGGALVPITSTRDYADYQLANADWVIVNLFPDNRACKIQINKAEQLIFLKGVFHD
ncbi:hypothetical protein ACJVQT_23165 [Enterobacter huaxiensis]|uniref:hypothetical protein n=1 Tax=Enterobacter huaxiensis TaxID=2494702 RepID=UPI002175959D|nr:hypothetical protein [Enterobacter huaxiensis]MCS5452479.1 hypothetical protein [Enterobacter huaxiensis]